MTLAIALSGADSIVMATDSREIEWVTDAKGRTRMSKNDDVPKLWNLSDYIGVMSASNVPGYDDWVVGLFTNTNVDRNSQSFRKVIESFGDVLNDDFYRYVHREHPVIVSESILDFVLCGYDREGRPKIARIGWSPVNRLFVPQVISRHYYVTGVTDIAKYLINKFKEYLPSMNTLSLQRLATSVVTETSTTEESVGGKVQIAVIEEGRKLQFVPTDKIEKLKAEVSTIINTDRLLSVIIGDN